VQILRPALFCHIAIVLAVSVGCAGRSSDRAHPVAISTNKVSAPPFVSDAATAPVPTSEPFAPDGSSVAATAKPPATAMRRSAVEWTGQWLAALRIRDTKALASLSSYPFQFDDTGAVEGCSAGAAASEELVEAAIRCLLDDELLSGALQANSEPLCEERKTLPRWAKRWRRAVNAHGALVTTEFGDNGISYYLAFVVAANGVRSVYRHAEFWPN
jgi:hypothetical protein